MKSLIVRAQYAWSHALLALSSPYDRQPTASGSVVIHSCSLLLPRAGARVVYSFPSHLPKAELLLPRPTPLVLLCMRFYARLAENT